MLFSKWTAVRGRVRARLGAVSIAQIRLLLSNIIAAISGVFASRVLLLLLQIMLARRLSLQTYGEYETLISSLALIGGLLGFGLDVWLLQEGGRKPEQLAHNLWQVLVLKSFGALALLALLITAWSHHIIYSLPYAIGMVGIIFESFIQTGYAALRARLRNGRVALFQTISPLLLLIVLWLMSSSTLSVTLLISVQLGCSVLISMFLLRAIWQVCGAVPFRLDLWRTARSAWLFVAADVLATIYGQFGVAVLARSVPPETVGLFKLGLNTVTTLYLIPSLIFLVALPLLNASSMNEASRRGMLRLLALALLVYGLACLVLLYFGGGLAIRITGGAKFDAAQPYVQVLSLLPLFKSLSFVSVLALLVYNRQRLRVLIQLVVAAVAVLLAGVLIPLLGAMGAAYLYLLIEVLLVLGYSAAALYVLKQNSL